MLYIYIYIYISLSLSIYIYIYIFVWNLCKNLFLHNFPGHIFVYHISRTHESVFSMYQLSGSPYIMNIGDNGTSTSNNTTTTTTTTTTAAATTPTTTTTTTTTSNTHHAIIMITTTMIMNMNITICNDETNANNHCDLLASGSLPRNTLLSL